MRKVKVSFTGKPPYVTWTIDQWADVGSPDLTISNSIQTAAVTFETREEKRRFTQGIHLCRAHCALGTIYLTPFK